MSNSSVQPNLVGEPLERLTQAHAMRVHHHKALWEAEKLFTWLSSIVLSAALIVATSDRVAFVPRLFAAAVLGLTGAVVCLIGLVVVKRERHGFVAAMQVFIHEYNRCFPYAAKRNYQIVPAASVLVAASRVVSGSMTVQEAFQVLLILLYGLFVVVVVVCVYLLIASRNAILG